MTIHLPEKFDVSLGGAGGPIGFVEYAYTHGMVWY